MTVKVNHSTTPDGSFSATGAAAWSADHTLVGVGTMAEQDANNVAITGGSITGTSIPAADVTGLGTMATQDANNVAITGGAISGTSVAGYIPTTEKAQALGVATLDSAGKVLIGQIPDAVIGALSYQGTWNATTNTPTLLSSIGVKGYYYVVSVAGTTNLNGVTDWQIGDWAVFDGLIWEKIDNTDSVTSVNGYTGAVNLTYTDLGAFPATSTTGSGNVVLATGATQDNPTISNYENFTPTTAPAYLEGRVWYDSTEKALAFYNDSSALAVHVGQDLIFKVINNTGSTIANGSPVYVTGTSSGQTYPNVALAKADVAATSSVIGLTNGAIANGAIGYVTSQGTIDNVNTSTFTVGQVLYLSPYSAGQLMNTLPPTGITVQVGVAAFINSSTGHIYVKQTTPLAIPASIITGTLGVSHGGTGLITVGTNGQVLTSNGTTLSYATPTTGTVTSVGGTGTISGISLNGTVTSSGNLTLGGALDLSSPPAIGATTANTGRFTSLVATAGLGGGAF